MSIPDFLNQLDLGAADPSRSQSPFNASSRESSISASEYRQKLARSLNKTDQQRENKPAPPTTQSSTETTERRQAKNKDNRLRERNVQEQREPPRKQRDVTTSRTEDQSTNTFDDSERRLPSSPPRSASPDDTASGDSLETEPIENASTDEISLPQLAELTAEKHFRIDAGGKVFGSTDEAPIFD